MKTLHDHLVDALEHGLYRSLHGWARRRARLLRQAGDVESYAEDLVQDAIVGTLSGRLTWDPTRIPLLHHLRRAIRCQSRHDLRHATRFPHEVIGPAIDQVVPPRDVPPREDEDVEQRARAVSLGLRCLAATDPEILLILDALDHEVSRRSAILEQTGLTLAAYKAARARLFRLRAHLPSTLTSARRRSAPRKRGRTRSRRP